MKTFDRNPETMERFKNQSHDLLANQLARLTYDGYPKPKQRLHGDIASEHVQRALGSLTGPSFARATRQLALPDAHQQAEFIKRALRLDSLGRPLHPWIDTMVARPDIGVALGTGFYWFHGPNETGDNITRRNDLDEPHYLLMERKDTGQNAFPGGHKEDEAVLETAYREGDEEVDKNVFNLREHPHTVTELYHGPLADLRATAHAWPVTTAFLFDIEGPVTTPMSWAGNPEEVNRVFWQPESKLGELFGSHKLLGELAIKHRA